LENPCWLFPILLNTCVYSSLLDILLFWGDKNALFISFLPSFTSRHEWILL
jgi:hypothetical protein